MVSLSACERVLIGVTSVEPYTGDATASSATLSFPAASTTAGVSWRISSARGLPPTQYTKTIGFLPRYVRRSTVAGWPGLVLRFANFAGGNGSENWIGGTFTKFGGAVGAAGAVGADCAWQAKARRATAKAARNVREQKRMPDLRAKERWLLAPTFQWRRRPRLCRCLGSGRDLN